MEPECNHKTLMACGISEKVKFRPYQLEGIKWLIRCYDNRHGGILADEMGLGKTCQTIAFLAAVSSRTQTGGKRYPTKHLVVCPLSVIDGWQEEFKRFAPSVDVLTYRGDKDERSLLQPRVAGADVVLTTYELCLKDTIFFKSGTWDVVVIDEGHRLKNSESLLHVALAESTSRCRILLTGTPIQNNLGEMYNLLSFVSPDTFNIVDKDRFISTYASTGTDREVAAELQKKVRPFMLRRTKASVAVDIPPKAEVVVCHDITELQKKYYKAILLRNYDAFQTANRTQLLNVLMQLRKCVDHPYLFDGVEPEPFEAGEHLVTASGKLMALDALLQRLHVDGHRVLLFSQMTRMLDILQDYVAYRGYKYERLDGSVRGEERFAAVRNFCEQDDTFIFLLSTRAGGQGLNLTRADTVVFYDSDFNPQVDVQAAARAHRIGQTRPVKILKLLARHTVEEVIMQRARKKLKLTKAVMDENNDMAASVVSFALASAGSQQLQDALKLGLDKLLAHDTASLSRADPSCGCDVDAALGVSKDGQWVDIATPPVVTAGTGEESSGPAVPDSDEVVQGIYEFEGKDYAQAVAAADEVFDKIVSEHLESIHLQGRLRSDQPVDESAAAPGLGKALVHSRRRKPLTAEQLAERRQKLAAAAARRAAQEAADEGQRAERRRLRLKALWEKNSYLSCKVDSSGDGSSEESDAAEPLPDTAGSRGEVSLNLASAAGGLIEEDGSEDQRDVHYVSGDVTRPEGNIGKPMVIVHCVDDSGSWGRGGVFDALASLSPLPASKYEMAANMKDLALGDVHLIDLQEDNAEASVSTASGKYVALVVAQHRDRSGRLSGIRLDALETGLGRIRRAAAKLGSHVSIHLPRIGYNTPNFNWYGTERLIRKILVTEGSLDTYIYYYPRRMRTVNKRRRISEEDEEDSKEPAAAEPTDPKILKKGSTCDEASSVEREGSSSSCLTAAASAEPRMGVARTADCRSCFAAVSDIFADVSVAFDESVEATEQERLRPLVAMHSGEVHADGVQSNTTYVITDERTDKKLLLEKSATFVTPMLSSRWLSDSAAAGEQLDITPYLVS